MDFLDYYFQRTFLRFFIFIFGFAFQFFQNILLMQNYNKISFVDFSTGSSFFQLFLALPRISRVSSSEYSSSDFFKISSRNGFSQRVRALVRFLLSLQVSLQQTGASRKSNSGSVTLKNSSIFFRCSEVSFNSFFRMILRRISSDICPLSL